MRTFLLFFMTLFHSAFALDETRSVVFLPRNSKISFEYDIIIKAGTNYIILGKRKNSECGFLAGGNVSDNDRVIKAGRFFMTTTNEKEDVILPGPAYNYLLKIKQGNSAIRCLSSFSSFENPVETSIADLRNILHQSGVNLILPLPDEI